MNAYLATLGAGVRLAEGRAQVGTPPDVMFGCERVAGDECENVEDRERMRLAVGRPSGDWITWAAAEAERAGVTRLLVITLEVGNYMIRQRDFLGNKEIRFGTDYTVRLPWLTSLDQPVSVPGQPLEWRVALRNMVAQLTGRVSLR
jgi:hypothetical protein